MLRYLAHGYTYNQNPPLTGYPLETFLFSHKAGYCQQFSGSMALLLRMAGIPARVASGFTSGDQDATGEWVVSDLNAHAWVEVWFPTYGWVRFDPTPPVAPARSQFRNLAVVKPTPNGPGSSPSGVSRNAATGGGSHGVKHALSGRAEPAADRAGAAGDRGAGVAGARPARSPAGSRGSARRGRTRARPHRPPAELARRRWWRSSTASATRPRRRDTCARCG